MLEHNDSIVEKYHEEKEVLKCAHLRKCKNDIYTNKHEMCLVRMSDQRLNIIAMIRTQKFCSGDFNAFENHSKSHFFANLFKQCEMRHILDSLKKGFSLREMFTSI